MPSLLLLHPNVSLQTEHMRSEHDSAAFPPDYCLAHHCSTPPLPSTLRITCSRFFARVAKMPGPVVPAATARRLTLPLRLRLLRSCVFCFAELLAGTMWDSRGGWRARDSC